MLKSNGEEAALRSGPGTVLLRSLMTGCSGCDFFLQARQAMQEQLARNKELTQKIQRASESEEEEGGAKEEGEPLVPDVVNEVQVKVNGPNPWMFRNHSSDAREAEVQEGPEEGAEPAGHEASESEEEGPGAEEDMLLKEFEERRSLRQKSGLNGPVGSPETKGEQGVGSRAEPPWGCS